MNVLNKLLNILIGKVPAEKENLVEAGVCPNCWGMQEYENEYREIVKERNKDPHNQKAFVEQFIETHLTGVRLKREEDKLICPSCDGVHKVSSTNAN